LDGLDLSSIVSSIATQGPLVGFLFYLHVQNGKKLDTKDLEIAELNKELRENQEKSFDKLATISKDQNTVLSAINETFKEALKNG
jgi:hypothetical protein